MAAGSDVLANAFTDHVRQKVMYNMVSMYHSVITAYTTSILFMPMCNLREFKPSSLCRSFPFIFVQLLIHNTHPGENDAKYYEHSYSKLGLAPSDPGNTIEERR